MAAAPGPIEVESISFDEILEEYRYAVPEVPNTPRQLFFFARKQGYGVRYKPMKAYFQFPLPPERVRPIVDLEPLDDANFDSMLTDFETAKGRPPEDPSEVLRFIHDKGFEPSFSAVLRIFQQFGQAVPKRIEQRYKKPVPKKPLPALKGKKWRPGSFDDSESFQAGSPAPKKPLPPTKSKKRMSASGVADLRAGNLSPVTSPVAGGGGFPSLTNSRSAPGPGANAVLNTGTTVTFSFAFTPYTESGAVISTPPTDVELIKEMALDAGNAYLDERGEKPETPEALHAFAHAEQYDLTLEEVVMVFADVVEELTPKLERVMSDNAPIATRRVSYPVDTREQVDPPSVEVDDDVESQATVDVAPMDSP